MSPAEIVTGSVLPGIDVLMVSAGLQVAKSSILRINQVTQYEAGLGDFTAELHERNLWDHSRNVLLTPYSYAVAANFVRLSLSEYVFSPNASHERSTGLDERTTMAALGFMALFYLFVNLVIPICNPEGFERINEQADRLKRRIGRGREAIAGSARGMQRQTVLDHGKRPGQKGYETVTWVPRRKKA